MAKIGLRATVALLTKGYTKKEIEELAAIDEEQENTPEPEEQPKEKEAEEQPDYKAMYEELLKSQEEKEKEIEEKDKQIKEIQKTNIHENNLPDIEQQAKEEEASLIEAFKSFY